jgi:hypothetical protein
VTGKLPPDLNRFFQGITQGVEDLVVMGNSRMIGAGVQWYVAIFGTP